MNRMTVKYSPYPCKIAQKCTANDWMYELFKEYAVISDMCHYCPFKMYINRLAELEDKAEKFEDDRK